MLSWFAKRPKAASSSKEVPNNPYVQKLLDNQILKDLGVHISGRGNIISIKWGDGSCFSGSGKLDGSRVNLDVRFKYRRVNPYGEGLFDDNGIIDLEVDEFIDKLTKILLISKQKQSHGHSYEWFPQFGALLPYYHPRSVDL
jgi:hypothetical protein